MFYYWSLGTIFFCVSSRSPVTIKYRKTRGELRWTMDKAEAKTALVMAHPGHELRVYQWLRLTRPLCFVLTDGSGGSGKSRLHSTTRLLEQNGARRGSIYGRLTDRE